MSDASPSETFLSPGAELAPGTSVLDGRFRVVRLLGSGGMGFVYLAEQVSLGRPVALKVLRSDLATASDFTERFRREALLLSSVEHPAVVRVIDYGKWGDVAGIAGAVTNITYRVTDRTGNEIAKGSMPVSAAEGKQITTIEGLAQGGVLNRVQKAWVDNDVPQCGYCQSGMIMAVAALLKAKPKPTDADINKEITNICRCGTFQQVREAIHAAAASA